MSKEIHYNMIEIISDLNINVKFLPWNFENRIQIILNDIYDFRN